MRRDTLRLPVRRMGQLPRTRVVGRSLTLVSSRHQRSPVVKRLLNSKRTSILAGILCLLVSGAVEARKPIVAVFNIEFSGTRLAKRVEGALRDYLEVKLTSSGVYEVVPSDQLKKALSKQKVKSYKQCYKNSCQIKIGQELAADRTLATRVTRIGPTCMVSMKLYHLRRMTTEKASTASGSCKEQGIMASVQKAAKELIGKRPSGGAAPRAAQAAPMPPATAAADRIKKVDGTVLSGKLADSVAGLLVIKTSDGQQTVPLDQVDSVQFRPPAPRAAFSSPQKTFQRMRQAALRGALKTYIDCHSSYYQIFLNHQVAKLTPGKFTTRLKREYGSAQIELLETAIKGKMAVVKVRRKKGTSHTTGELRFVRENHEWKMILPL